MTNIKIVSEDKIQLILDKLKQLGYTDEQANKIIGDLNGN